jgi:small conductance mechanosensitive channel
MEWSKVTDWLNTHGWKILLIIAVAVVIYFLLRRLIPPILRRAVSVRMQDQPEEEIKKRADTISRVLVGAGLVIIILVALLTVLAEVGVSIAPALAGMGIAGIAIGFGAQSLIKDYLAGFFILLENQYRVGDVVRIADIAGLVEEITLRRTVLRDLDGIVHSVPNGEIKVASNFTKEWSRVNMNVSVAYGEDLDHVIEVVNRIGKEMAEDPNWGPLILTPPQVLRVDAFEDSGIAIKILGDTKPIQQWAVMGELRRRIKKVFDEEGIEIPWPHTKVYFGGPLEQQMARAVEHRPSKREEVPEKYETRPTEEVLPPESEGE